jgi:DNA-binding beta-propeller fold protein YncE
VKIPGSGVRGIASARDFGRGFISASDPGFVTIFDLKTLAIIEKVTVGAAPNGIILDPKIGRVFTADRGSKRETAIDAEQARLSASLTVWGTERSILQLMAQAMCS